MSGLDTVLLAVTSTHLLQREELAANVLMAYLWSSELCLNDIKTAHALPQRDGKAPVC